MMEDKLKCISLNIHTTTRCTLKCKKCGWSFPYFTTPIDADVDKTIAALDELFQVYDWIEEVRFGGAEAFLYADIEQLMLALTNYTDQFSYGIIITNGTYIPKQSLLDTIKKLPYPFCVRVDNYGSLSSKYNELISILKDNNIKIDERIYTGDSQAFGGWVYYGDYTDKQYTSAQLKSIFNSCRLPDDGAILFDDKLTNCCYATAGDLLGKVAMPEREVIHLLDEKSVEQKRQMVRSWREEPFEACKYCNGFDPVNSLRIPAAEQIKE